MKILNLYAGIGGNRKLWGNEYQITAIEINPEIAAIYKRFYPQDIVIVADAHEYLLKHYAEYDFIWSSPPCPTHSHMNNFLNAQGCIRYPDMTLWQEIIFLKHFFKGKYLVENVKSYYEPFLNPQEIERHFFWSNFIIPKLKINRSVSITNAKNKTRRNGSEHIKELQKYLNIDISEFKNLTQHNRYQMLANCVNPHTGLFILKCAFKYKQKTLDI